MVEYDTITIHYGQKNYLIIIGQSYSTLVEARNTIGFIRKWLLWSWEFVPFGKFGMVSDSGEPPPFELVPSATRIIIVVKTIPSSDGMKSVITYSALFPAAYAAMPETKAAEYIAPDSIIMIMTGKRVEDMPACFSSRWLRQIGAGDVGSQGHHPSGGDPGNKDGFEHHVARLGFRGRPA